ncbi:MAG: ABC transporter permease [Spirochaetes bacterium]|nr:ABC transporter permease [Spirochaetota bacterium]
MNSRHEYKPPLPRRLFSVWYRHMRVYTKNLVANGLPPFLEPLIFLVAIGLGLGRYITEMKGVPYLPFLATGILVTTAMFTASFECTYGTFIRLEYDKAYDGMLSAPITVRDLFLGEILWAGTKGFFFSLAVLSIVSAFGILSIATSAFAPFVGFATGVMFSSLALFVTSFIRDLNQFNFYFTGFISPMFFFSGVVFSLDTLPKPMQWVAEVFPLTHSVRIVRSICFGESGRVQLFDAAYIVGVTFLCAFFAIRRLRARLVS